MKLYSFKHILPVAALALTLGMGSCINDLDVTPIDPSTNMTPDFEAIFTKCYANLAMAGNGGANGDCDVDGLDGGTTGLVRQLFNAQELTTDEAMCCWGDEGIPAFNFNQWGASHPMLKGFYYRLYFGVTMCNHFLEKVPAGFDAQKVAEVRFLRAFYYLNLMDHWGNVPFLTTVSSAAAPQAKRAEVFQFIEDEMVGENGCLRDMAEPKSLPYGRADRAAGWMLLTRLYLNAEVYTGIERWSDAANYAEKVMKESGYSLFKGGKGKWTAYQMLFMGDNGDNGAQCEAVFPLYQDGVTTTSWGTTLFLMASTYKNDMLIADGLTNGTSEQWGGNRCRPDLVKKFFPNSEPPTEDMWAVQAAAGDDRALFWGLDRTLSIDEVSNFNSGFSCAKFSNLYSDGSAAHNSQFCDTDYFLMRAAEAWLSYAEATARMNNDVMTEEGVDAINEIRSRAHTTTKDNYTMDELLDEWSREFYFEGRRRTDLIRFGKFGGNSDYKWQWKGGVQAGTNFSANLNIFAIPDSDLNANGNLDQNPGY